MDEANFSSDLSSLNALTRDSAGRTIQGTEAIDAQGHRIGPLPTHDEDSIAKIDQLAEVFQVCRLHVPSISTRSQLDLPSISTRSPLEPQVLDRLHGMLAETCTDWKTPMFVVLGAESCGKSSILERVTMLPIFPRSAGLCTRMPIKIQLRRTPEPAPPTLERFNLETNQIEGQKRTITLSGKMDVRLAMEDAMRAEAGGVVTGISHTHMLILSVSSPDVPNLDLVDMPGLVSARREGEPDDLPEQTEELLRSFVQARPSLPTLGHSSPPSRRLPPHPPLAFVQADFSAWPPASPSLPSRRSPQRNRDHALFLAVVRSTTPPNTAPVLGKLVQELGIEENTLGIFSMCDEFSDAALGQSLVPRLLGTARDGVSMRPHGFIATMNAPVHEGNSMQNLTKQAMAELAWFRSKSAMSPVLGGDEAGRPFHDIARPSIDLLWPSIH